MRLAANGLLVGALALAVAVPASAATIGFEVAPPGGFVGPLPYSEAGFTLTSNQFTNGIFDATFGLNSNGTDIFGWCASDCSGTQVITVVGPTVFSVSSIDVGYLNLFLEGMSVNLEGVFSGGGSIITNLPVERTWTTYALTGFTGLSSLRITAVDPSGELLLDSAIDNLVVNATPVPEPAALLLLGTGLGAVAARRRLKKRA